MPIQIEKIDEANPPHRRFYQVPEVAAILATSKAQVYALVRQGELPAIKLGGRGQWRVESNVLDRWIEEKYEETRQYVAANPMYPERDQDPV